MTYPRISGRRFGLIVAIAFVLYAVIGFVVAPPIVKSQLVKRLSSELGRSVRIENVRLNPLMLSGAIEGLSIVDRDGAGFFGWERVYVNFDVVSFFAKEWRFQEITALAPSGRVVVNPDGSLNFTDLIEKFKPQLKAEEKPGWPLRIAKLNVAAAVLDFTDQSRPRPFKTQVGPVTFSLVQFHTSPNRDAPYQFSAATEAGEKLRWLGTLSVNPLGSNGEFVIEGINLPKYAAYYYDWINLDILSGRLDLSGSYKINAENGLSLARLNEGRVHLVGLKVAERDSTAAVLELEDLEIGGVFADTVTRKAKIGSIALNGGRASVHRLPDGTIDVLAMLKPPSGATPPEGASASTANPVGSAPSPQLEIDAITVRRFSAAFEDRVPSRIATQTIENADVDVKNFTLAEGAQIPLRVQLTLPAQGNVTLDGTVGLFPVQTALAVDVTNVPLVTVSPYLEPLVNVHVVDGIVGAKGEANISLPANAAPQLGYTGDISIRRFVIFDGVANEPLASWAELALGGITLTASPLSVKVNEVVWSEPSAHVMINADRAVNLLAIMKPKAAPAASDDATAAVKTEDTAASPAPKIEVAQVLVKDGTFKFTDRSVQPEVSIGIDHFSGEIRGLSSNNPARAKLAMRATVDGSGPVAISGQLDPLGPKMFIDLHVDLKDVGLTPFSPYTGKFAGYELARGKLFLDVNARLDNRNVDMKNAVTLQQFTLGAPTNSPDATKLPVRLAIALLKDGDGKIVLDLPVRGSLDDPKFRISGVVLNVIGNLLTKAAASPFSLLGAMFGGGGDELAFQEFQPGEAVLKPKDLPKLETLTKALQGRPALNLEIAGAFDAGVDRHVLQQRRLSQIVRNAIWDQRRQLDPTVPPPDQRVVSPGEELAMMRTMYVKTFPDGVAVDVPVPTAPVAVAAPVVVPPRRSLLQRATDLATFKAWRERKANEKKAAEQAPAPVDSTPVTAPVDEPPVGPALAEMKARLTETMEVTEGDLRRLAAARAQRVRDYFVQQEISPERLFLANVTNESKGARVFLQLQ